MIGGECREPGVFFLGPVWCGADAAVFSTREFTPGQGGGEVLGIFLKVWRGDERCTCSVTAESVMKVAFAAVLTMWMCRSTE
jgi:hypothetical protein